MPLLAPLWCPCSGTDERRRATAVRSSMRLRLGGRLRRWSSAAVVPSPWATFGSCGCVCNKRIHRGRGSVKPSLQQLDSGLTRRWN